MHYLHDMAQIAHCDVKEENIVQNGHNIKIIDFGSAQFLDGKVTRRVNGSPYYLSPEICLRAEIFDLRKNDVWSFGIMLFKLLTGDKLTYMNSSLVKNDWDEFVQKQNFEQVDENIREIIVSCLKFDPQMRTDFGQLLTMKCFHKFDYLKKNFNVIRISPEDIQRSIKCLNSNLYVGAKLIMLSKRAKDKVKKKNLQKD